MLFEHAELYSAISLLYQDMDIHPQNIKNQYGLYRKFEEISADRVGLLASGDFEAAIRAMIIMISGLNDNLLNLELSQLFDYAERVLDDLKKLKVFPDTKHPAMPLRIMALKAFSESMMYKSALAGEEVKADPELEANMSELTRLIKIYPSNPEEYWMMMAKASAIYQIVAADKEINFEEKSGLLDVISNFCWCPETIMKEIDEKGPQTFLEIGIN